MTINTPGIVIREQTTGEQDRLVTILTRDNGVIRAFVNGARNPKNKNVGATGLLCYSDLCLDKTKKDVYIVREASPLQIFFALREDIVRLSLAQYFAELTYELAPREESAGEFLSLLLNAIHLVTEGKKDLRLVKAATELRMLSIAGYMPDIVSCCRCGTFESKPMYFSTHSGELFCEKCKPESPCAKVGMGIITAMRYICFSGPGKIFSFSLPKDSLMALSELTEKYLKNVTARKYKTLDFYKEMSGY